MAHLLDSRMRHIPRGHLLGCQPAGDPQEIPRSYDLCAFELRDGGRRSVRGDTGAERVFARRT